jgi:hypothetical protein
MAAWLAAWVECTETDHMKGIGSAVLLHARTKKQPSSACCVSLHPTAAPSMHCVFTGEATDDAMHCTSMYAVNASMLSVEASRMLCYVS